MVGAVRIVSVERGHDPRDFTLVAFGGAGPLHGCSLATLLGITRVLVPPAPGVLCADGLLAADLKAEFSRTLPKAGAGRYRGGAPDLRRADGAGRRLAHRREGGAVDDRQQSKRRAAALSRPGRRGRRAWADSKHGLEAAFAAAHKASTASPWTRRSSW